MYIVQLLLISNFFMNFIKKLPVYLLGIIFIVFSLQFFAMIFTHAAMPPMSGLAEQYMGVLFQSGYVWVVKVLELVLGILILVPRTRRIALVLIAPICVNIFLSEVLIIQPPIIQMTPALLVVIFNAIGLYQYRESYMPMVRK